MSKILVATTVALLLASCGTPTVMYNPETKEMAQCERPPMAFLEPWDRATLSMNVPRL